MGEPTTFEEFEDYIQKKSYLYPVVSTILKKDGEFYKNTTDDIAYQANRDNVGKLWEEYKSAPVVECIVGFKHYFVETVVAVEKFVGKNLQGIKTPIKIDNYNKISKGDYDSCSETVLDFDSGEVPLYYQPYLEVTDLLEKSTDPKKGCKMFSDALQKGKAVYALKGPKIHKWTKDEKGHIIRDKCGDFRMNLNDELIFWSVVCAPFYEIEDNKEYDLRFIADTEILDVAEDYKKKLEELVDEPHNKDKRKKYQQICESKLPACYGVYIDEVNNVREILKPGEDEAVYFVTAEKGYSENAKGTVVFLMAMYNDFKDCNLRSVAYMTDGGLNRYRDKFYIKEMSEGKSKFINAELKNKTNRRMSKIFEESTHDKIPHSYIGSMLKLGEFGTLMSILGEELTDVGLRGFEIENIRAPQNKSFNRHFFANIDDVDQIARIQNLFLMRYKDDLHSCYYTTTKRVCEDD
jgi:hypothetical protein